MGRCKCDDCRSGRDRREEIRHGGVTEEEIPYRKPGGRKNKKWCRGREGREHVPVRIPGPWYDRDACQNCGKILEYYWKRIW